MLNMNHIHNLGKQFLSSTWKEALLDHKDITLECISEEW